MDIVIIAVTTALVCLIECIRDWRATDRAVESAVARAKFNFTRSQT